MLRKCLFLSRSPSDENARPGTFEHYVVHAMSRYPELELSRSERPAPNLVSEMFLKQIMSADLVIADLSDLGPNGFYELGIRHATARPTVHMAATDHLPFDVQSMHFVSYEPTSRGQDHEEIIDQLASEIGRALSDEEGLYPPSRVPTIEPPRTTQRELATQIRQAADAIRELRLNSTGDVVASLDAIAHDLDAMDETPKAMRDAALKVLKVLSRIADQLASVKGAKIIIAGILSLVLGGAGYAGLTIYGLTLAFWQGPEIFTKALETLSKHKPSVGGKKQTGTQKGKPKK